MFNTVLHITFIVVPPGGARVPPLWNQSLVASVLLMFSAWPPLMVHFMIIWCPSLIFLQLMFASSVHLWLILDECVPQIRGSAGGSDMKLRVSLDNLLAAEQVGRWWIVGSSWSGAPMISEQGDMTSKRSTAEGQVLEPQKLPALWQSTCLFS